MTETPDIIYTQQFVAANVQYLDYSEREEAVDLLNDFDLETGEIMDSVYSLFLVLIISEKIK